MHDTYSVASLFPSQAFSGLGRGSARLEASYVGQSHGKNAYDSYLPKAVGVLGCFLATYILWITDGPSRDPGPAITQHDNTRSLCGGQGWRRAMARQRETVTWWKSSRPARHYVITWRQRERGGVTAKGSLVPRLHHPNVWEVDSGNEASQDDL